jgi:C_GCAxxG_C_C family probable redox protein
MDDVDIRMMQLKVKGYCCAQILLILALESQGKENPDLTRAANGLCFGINGSGEVCGALSGAACLISLYAGKGKDDETPDSQYTKMLSELTDWFRSAIGDEYGGTRCGDILARFPDRGVCGPIVADTYEKCMEILVSNGFDPATGRDE